MRHATMQVTTTPAPELEWAVLADVHGRLVWMYATCPGIPTADYFVGRLGLPAGTTVDFTRAAKLPDLRPHCWAVLTESAGELVWHEVSCPGIPTADWLTETLGYPAGTPIEFTQAVNLELDSRPLLSSAA